MANNDNTNDPNEFENLYSQVDETAEGQGADGVRDDDIVDAPYSASDDLSEFNDLDDGSEDGIFAAPQSEVKRPKKSSSTGLFATVAFLAVVGGGGYFYLSDPASLEKIKHNLTGSVSGEDVTLPSFQMTDVAGTAAPAPTDGAMPPAGSEQGAVPAPVPAPDMAMADQGAAPSPLEGEAMPPQPEPVVPPVADGAAPTVPPENTPPAPVPPMEAPPVPGASAPMADVAPAPVPPMSEAMPTPVVDAPSPDVPAPDTVSQLSPADVAVPASAPDESHAMGTADVPPPVDSAMAPVPVQEGAVVPTPTPAPADTAAVSKVPSPAPTDTPADAPVEASRKVDNAKIFKPKPIEDKGTTLLNDEGVDPTKSAAATSGPVTGSSTPAENAADMTIAEEKEPETKYFDSPPGDIMSRLPAPAMDPKRGKTESLIIVNPKSKAKTKPPKSPSKASGSMSEKVVIETTSLEAKIVSASRALKLARYDAARQMYDELYALNPREPRVLMGRAVLFQKLGENGRAISTYEELLAINPDNAEAVVNLSGLVTKQMPAVALEKLLNLRSRYPDNPAIAAQLGVAYANTGNLEDAYRYLSLASSMQPNNAQHYFNMAVVSEKAGQFARAVDLYEKALEVDATTSGASTVSRDTIYDRLTRLRGN